MSITSQSTNGSRPTSRHDTGFPDTLASVTTSMRHPDAIIDPGFAISSEHIDPAKALHRSKKSLLRKHRHTLSAGKINEEFFGEQDHMERPSSSTSTANSTTDLPGPKPLDAGAGVAQSHKVAEGPKGPDDALVTPGFQYTSDGGFHHGNDQRRRTGIFRNLLHKN
ncbi:hypothetical protein F5Y14DRAFT_197268 [Nemania sp. NC0429]|nr:hypothetical protein F5Y14DRAFT_197268 [Nemania sp. NC0429]